MINFLVTLFFVASMACLLAVPMIVTFLFTRAHDSASRRRYLLQLVSLLAAFVLCLAISGRIYDASLTPEQRAALETESTSSSIETTAAD